MDIIIFLELVQLLGCTDYNVSIMAMAIIVIKLWHILPINGDPLVDNNFANTSKPVQLDNRQDVQG